jgi:hypothetical protein
MMSMPGGRMLTVDELATRSRRPGLLTRPDGSGEPSYVSIFPAEVIGYKLRCGGEEPSAFPSPEVVARCLRQCLDANVPFKATAGLHHPLRRFDGALQTHMHGFVNLFGAGVLAGARGLNADQIQEILIDEDPSHFVFSDDQFSWKNWSVSTGDITSLRQKALLSFGSCSFNEPRDDLRALGWL